MKLKLIQCAGCQRVIAPRADGSCRLCGTANKPPGRANKYGAKLVYVCGLHGAVEPVMRDKQRHCPQCDVQMIKFDSRAEYKRWLLLMDRYRRGEISHPERQVRFAIIIAGKKIGDYLADFVYTDAGRKVVEDVKGQDTALSKFKRKCVEAAYGLEIVIIKKGNDDGKRRTATRRTA